MARKRGKSKVGSVIKIRGYERAVGPLPPRNKRGTFVKKSASVKMPAQSKLFK